MKWCVCNLFWMWQQTGADCQSAAAKAQKIGHTQLFTIIRYLEKSQGQVDTV